MTEADYKHIIESATDYAIFTIDLEGMITSWNSGAERLLGWKQNEALGQHSKIIFPGEQAKEDAVDEIRSAWESGSATDERWHIRKDGSQFWAIGRMMSVTNDTGEIIGYVKILLDQTERKNYEQKLEQINETLEGRIEERTAALVTYQDRLRSLASELNKAEERERHRLATDLHDNLGQILAVCSMELELLQKQLQENDVGVEVSNLKGLLDEAIKYTRELMSDLKPPAGLNEEDLVTIMDWLKSKMKKHGLEVTIQDDHKPKPLSSDIRNVLLQSVRELLFNVLRHAGVSEARIILKRLGNHVELTVEDDGVGFNPDQQNLPERDGGFGLFNISERLDLLGGRIEIQSEPGNGSSITLHTPLESKKTPAPTD